MRFGGWGRVASFGCGMQLAMLPWQYDPPVPGMYVTLCTYPPAVGSWVTCIDEVLRNNSASEQEYNALLADSVVFGNVACEKAGGGLVQYTAADFTAIIANASAHLQDSKEGPLTAPVRLDARPRIRTIEAVRAEFLNLDFSNDSALLLYYFFGAVFLFMLLAQQPRLRRWFLQTPAVNRLRACIELPTMWATERHTQHSVWGLGGLLPTSFEGSLIAALFVVHTWALFGNYAVDYREVLEPVGMQRLQGLANRSGILAFGMLPLIILFSMRTSAFINLSGLHYTTFLVLHRWLGRLMVVDSFIHSVAFYQHEKLNGELARVVDQFWWTAGIIAMWVSLVMLVPAVGAVRSRWYETFLYTHIAFAIAFLYFCWDHVRSFGWLNWIWASSALWGVERLYRVYLVVRNGGVIYADISTINDELVVITAPKPRRWKSHPTQFAFVYFFLPSIFWQSHPITVSDVGPSLEVVVSVKSGATRVLCDAAKTRTRIPIALEGPYGHTQSLQDFEKILLIGGGSGVPGPLALSRAYPDADLVVTTRKLNIVTAYHLDELAVESHNVDIYYTAGDEAAAHLPFVRRGRPDLVARVAGLAAHHSVVIVCCGPPSLNDYVRNLAAATLRKHPDMILEYIEEYQVW